MCFSISFLARVLQEAVKATIFLTAVKYPMPGARDPAQTLEYVVLLTPALRVNSPFPSYCRELDLPRSIVVQGELNPLQISSHLHKSGSRLFLPALYTTILSQ